MAYSKAYQEVIAGVVRETERVPFFRNNTIVGSGRLSNMAPTGGKKQPTIDKNFLQTEFVGKSDHRTVPALNAYMPNSINP